MAARGVPSGVTRCLSGSPARLTPEYPVPESDGEGKYSIQDFLVFER